MAVALSRSSARECRRRRRRRRAEVAPQVCQVPASHRVRGRCRRTEAYCGIDFFFIILQLFASFCVSLTSLLLFFVVVPIILYLFIFPRSSLCSVFVLTIFAASVSSFFSSSSSHLCSYSPPSQNPYSLTTKPVFFMYLFTYAYIYISICIFNNMPICCCFFFSFHHIIFFYFLYYLSFWFLNSLFLIFSFSFIFSSFSSAYLSYCFA